MEVDTKILRSLGERETLAPEKVKGVEDGLHFSILAEANGRTSVLSSFISNLVMDIRFSQSLLCVM